MSYRIIQINSALVNESTILALVDKYPVQQYWHHTGNNEMQSYYLLIDTEVSQAILDALSNILGHDEGAKIIVHPIEAVLPKPQKTKEDIKNEKKRKLRGGLSREELYEDVYKGAKLNSDFLYLVFFSTLVAGVGLIQDSPAIVIGAMVIAPMLGSHLALALGTVLADFDLSFRALKTSAVGFFFTLVLSVLIGYFMDVNLESKEIISRTSVEMNAIVLALASGAAGVLSLTSGVSSVLVGVMVAVALLPPASAFGILLGNGNFNLAWGALILLLVNIVCVNIAANLVFLFKGIAPRSWYEKEKARKKTFVYLVLWFIMLAVLATLVYYRNHIGA